MGQGSQGLRSGGKQSAKQQLALAESGSLGLCGSFCCNERGERTRSKKPTTLERPAEREMPIAGAAHARSGAFYVEDDERLRAHKMDRDIGLARDAEKPVPVLMASEAGREGAAQPQGTRSKQG